MRRLQYVVCMIASSAALAGAQGAPNRVGYTQADVNFMQGMIGHHGQALVMAAMAPTHGASSQLALFCKKITISQRDEIDLMSSWLKARGETVPDPNDAHHHMMMGGQMSMSMPDSLMPGMLTQTQLAQLDSARGLEFDRLFLRFMIQHHEGALTMVQALFDTPASGQESEIFGYATGVDNDQRGEIERMQKWLKTIPGGTQ